MTDIGTSRRFAALQDLVAAASIEPHSSGSIYE